MRGTETMAEMEIITITIKYVAPKMLRLKACSIRNCQLSHKSFQNNGPVGNKDSAKDNEPNFLKPRENTCTYLSNKLIFSNMFMQL